MAISARLSRKEGQKFAFTLGAAILAIALIGWFRGHPLMPIVLSSVALLLIAAGMLIPTRLGPVLRAWMQLGNLLSRFMTPITMAIIYFLVITPVGVVMRAAGKDPLAARNSTETLWISRGDKRQSDLERQF